MEEDPSRKKLYYDSQRIEIFYPQNQGWPSGLGNELIIRARQVQLLYPGLTTQPQPLSDLKFMTRLSIASLNPSGRKKSQYHVEVVGCHFVMELRYVGKS